MFGTFQVNTRAFFLSPYRIFRHLKKKNNASFSLFLEWKYQITSAMLCWDIEYQDSPLSLPIPQLEVDRSTHLKETPGILHGSQLNQLALRLITSCFSSRHSSCDGGWCWCWLVFGLLWIPTNGEIRFLNQEQILQICCSGKSKLACLAFSSLHVDYFQALEIDFPELLNDPEQTGSASEGNENCWKFGFPVRVLQNSGYWKRSTSLNVCCHVLFLSSCLDSRHLPGTSVTQQGHWLTKLDGFELIAFCSSTSSVITWLQQFSAPQSLLMAALLTLF